MMKKSISYSIIVLMVVMMSSCHNEKWEFPDFDYKTVYFPYQYPVRTLVLGDYVYDNDNDSQLKFLISSRIGGLYENKKDWGVDFRVNEALAANLLTSNGDTIKPLPSSYYTLNPVNKLFIPAGQFYGSVEVQLTQAFLDDMYAHKVRWVIPLEIISTDADSVLVGSTIKQDADPRIAGDWNVVPKNFTLFGIKYVNPYHGKYLRRGRSVISEAGSTLETVTYRQKYIEQDEIWPVKTLSKSDATITGTIRTSSGSPGSFAMKLAFSADGNCIISTADGSPFAVTGTGKFVKNGDEWGNKKRDAMHLNYVITQGTRIHTATDTLVFRDKDVRFEEFVPVVF